jgi:PAS domain S-box-containing protein
VWWNAGDGQRVAFDGSFFSERRRAAYERAVHRYARESAVVRDLFGDAAKMSVWAGTNDVDARPIRARRIGTWFIDLAGGGSYAVSAGLRALLGLDENAAIRSEVTFLHGIHPDDRGRICALQRRCLEAGEAYAAVCRVLRQDGGLRWVHIEATILREADGGRAGATGSVVELFDGETADGAELRFPIGLIKWRPAGGGTAEPFAGDAVWSGEMLRIAGRDPGDAVSTLEPFFGQVHTDDRARLRADILGDIRGQAAVPDDFRLVRGDGAIRWLIRHAEWVRDTAGRPCVLTEIFQDVTGRRRTEDALRNGDTAQRLRSEHFDIAQRVAQVGSIDRNLRTGDMHWSDELYRLLGFEPGEVPAADAVFETRVHPEDMALVRRLTKAVWTGDVSGSVEYRLKLPDGTIRWVHREGTVIHGDDGKPARVVSTLMDVSERRRLEEELRQQKDHLTLAQRIARVGSIERDLRTGRVRVSDEVYHLLGEAPGAMELTLDEMLTRVHPEDAPKIVELHRAAWAGQDVAPVEYRVIRPDGSMVWVRRESRIVRDGQGQPIRALSTLIDTTERKQMELALIESADKLRRSQGHMARAQSVGAIGSSEVDLRTGEVYWSDEFTRLLGLDPATTTPNHATMLNAILADDRVKLLSREEILKARGPLPPVELRVKRADGGTRWLQRQVVVIRDAQQTATSILFTLQDVTERRHMEAALIAYADEVRSSREHLSRAQSAGRIGSIEVDLRTNALLWSDELYRILGLDPGTAPSLDAFLTAVHPEDREAVRRSGEAILAGRMVEPTTYRIVRPDGEIRWLQCGTDYARDGHGREISVVATLMDVTAIQKAQEERAQLQEQVAHVQKLDSLGALSGGVAHDFNNLLTSILGSATLLAEEPGLSAEAQRLVRTVIRATQQGAELTRRLLSFGRRQLLSPVVIDLKTVAGDLDTILRRTLGEEIEFEIKPAADLWTVEADKGQLEAAIINLVVNARDAMPNGGKITIDMANRVFDSDDLAERAGVEKGAFVAISVSDSGTGMPPAVLERAFEPFFTTKPEGRGTGLGLAMVYGFCKQSGGYANIYSELGAGTRVTMFLPRNAKETVVATAATEETAKPEGGTESILLVEDDEMVRDFVETALSRMGYRVTAVRDAQAALKRINDGANAFDLLLTDLMLPGGMNGNQLAEQVAKIRPGLRVLFASGYTEDALIRQGRLQPGQMLIPKPFAGRELAKRVRQALDS